MAGEIKLAFTNEEVDEYINDLQKAVGNKERVYELLDLNHLPIFVAYLKRIGMSDYYLEFAAVAEIVRFKMRETLSCKNHKSCVVSDKGVEYETATKNFNYLSPKVIIGFDKNGTFWLDNERYFDEEKWRDNIFIRRKVFNSVEKDGGINGYGVAYLRFKETGRYFYMQNRKEFDGVPYFITESFDGLGYEMKRKTVDIGQPVYNGEFENTFAENFRMYTALFSRLKDWYKNSYGIDESNVDEYSDRIEHARLKDKIKELNEISEMLESNMYKHRLTYTVVSEKIDGLIEYLKGRNVELQEGKDVISELLELAEKVREENIVLESDECKENEHDSKEKQDLEVLDIDELNLIIKIKQNKIAALRKLQGRYIDVNNNYRITIHKIERKIEELKRELSKVEKEPGDKNTDEISL